MERLPITCRYTGIVGDINMPVPPTTKHSKLCLEFTHPLSHIDSVIDVTDEGMRYMRQLDTEVLAGMFITIIRYVKALKTKSHASFLNAEISKAGKGALMHCVKALASYAVPIQQQNRHTAIPKVTLDSPFNSKQDANRWLESVTRTLLNEALDTIDIDRYASKLVNSSTKEEYVSPNAFVSQEHLKEAFEARELMRQRMANDAMAQLEKIRSAKLASASKLSAGNYSKVELFYSEELDACAVELQIENPAISTDKIAKKLHSTFERERSFCTSSLPKITADALRVITKQLPTYSLGTLQSLFTKLQSNENSDILHNVIRVVELLIMNASSNKESISMLEELETAIITESVASNKLSLKERIAMRKAQEAAK